MWANVKNNKRGNTKQSGLKPKILHQRCCLFPFFCVVFCCLFFWGEGGGRGCLLSWCFFSFCCFVDIAPQKKQPARRVVSLAWFSSVCFCVFLFFWLKSFLLLWFCTCMFKNGKTRCLFLHRKNRTQEHAVKMRFSSWPTQMWKAPQESGQGLCTNTLMICHVKHQHKYTINRIATRH